MAKKVYLIRAAQFYKIGFSNNIKARLKQIQTGCPIKCEYIGYFPSMTDPQSLEKELHLRFQDHQTYGEWFDLGDDNIRLMIEYYNLKFIGNPYSELTAQTEISTASEALKEARSISASVNELERLYEEYWDHTFTDSGKSTVKRLISKYGFDCVESSLLHMTNGLDADQVFEKWNHVCRNYSTYERHVNSGTWRVYWKVKNKCGREDANTFLTFMMNYKLDLDDGFIEWVIKLIDNLDTFEIEPILYNYSHKILECSHE